MAKLEDDKASSRSKPLEMYFPVMFCWNSCEEGTVGSRTGNFEEILAGQIADKI